VGIGAAIVSAGFGDYTNSTCKFNPFGGCHDKAIESCLIFKRVELHTVKSRVVKAFPKLVLGWSKHFCKNTKNPWQN
jgi:hypothetical protein